MTDFRICASMWQTITFLGEQAPRPDHRDRNTPSRNINPIRFAPAPVIIISIHVPADRIPDAFTSDCTRTGSRQETERNLETPVDAFGKRAGTIAPFTGPAESIAYSSGGLLFLCVSAAPFCTTLARTQPAANKDAHQHQTDPQPPPKMRRCRRDPPSPTPTRTNNLVRNIRASSFGERPPAPIMRSSLRICIDMKNGSPRFPSPTNTHLFCVSSFSLSSGAVSSRTSLFVVERDGIDRGDHSFMSDRGLDHGRARQADADACSTTVICAGDSGAFAVGRWCWLGIFVRCGLVSGVVQTGCCDTHKTKVRR